ncbi:MAG: hypothetical protein ACPG06_05730 [Alphaproteobacteria bacterium]
MTHDPFAPGDGLGADRLNVAPERTDAGTPFSDYVARDRRLQILVLLAEQPDGTLNETLILEGLTLLGHRVGSGKLRATLAWLKEVEAIKLRVVAGLAIITLTAAGLDHITRRAAIPGIAQPPLGARFDSA